MGTSERFTELDFGWYAAIETFDFGINNNGPTVWAHHGATRSDAINTVIKKYNEKGGAGIAQFLHSGLIADYDISKINPGMHGGDMLYFKSCKLGDDPMRYNNRVRAVSANQFDGANCLTNKTKQPYLYSLEKMPLPVVQLKK